jgi:plasmid stabilization system protein ParE
VPQVIVTQRALTGIRRCRSFLDKAGQQVVRRAMEAIDHQFALLETSPAAGRPFQGDLHLRELIIHVGDSGYVALYRYESDRDAIIVLAFRHQREAGY